VPLRVAPLGGEATRARRHHDGLGLIRAGDGSELGGPPRVLLVGDSHLMGVVPNAENASDRLERSLRAQPGLERASVLNASCGFYSLHQLVLRARSLADRLRPDLIVLAVFLGNDFVELEDTGRPHLDDALVERPADASPPPETTSARQKKLDPAGEDALFWQGLNQACFFAEHPERLEPVLSKARRSIELAQELARAGSIPLLITLVPSYDLVFPERTRSRSAAVAEVVAAGANATLRARFLALLAELQVPSVDVVDAFEKDGRDALYATDYHLHAEGHRLLAEALVGPVTAALSSRR
jgi:lysophospholipase L1-like esterase